MFGTLMQDEKIGPHGGGRFCAFSVQQFVGWPNKLSLHYYTALHYTTLHLTLTPSILSPHRHNIGTA